MNSRRLMSDMGLPPLWRCRSGLRLFRLDVRCFDYRPPLLNIVLVKCPCPFRRALLVRWDFQTQLGEQSAYLRIDESLDDRAVELSDDVVARTFGSPKALPPRNVETGYTYLVHDRNIGGRDPARLGHHAICFDLAIAQKRQRSRCLGTHEIDMPGHQILICRAAAAIEHKLELCAGEVLEVDTADVCRAAGADARSGCSIWIRLQPRDQFRDISRRESNLCD